jgi:hypothetical protein
MLLIFGSHEFRLLLIPPSYAMPIAFKDTAISAIPLALTPRSISPPRLKAHAAASGEITNDAELTRLPCRQGCH